MMCKSGLLLAITFACAGLVPAQAAPPGSATYTVKGTINSGCVVPQSPPMTLSTTVPSSGKLDPALANATWTITGLSCNSGSRISLSARSLRLNAPLTSLTPSQSQTVNFTASASGWAPSVATVTTGETTSLGSMTYYAGAAQTQNAPKTGSIIVSVSNFVVSTNKGSSANSAKPVSGAYSATIVLTLAPSA